MRTCPDSAVTRTAARGRDTVAAGTSSRWLFQSWPARLNRSGRHSSESSGGGARARARSISRRSTRIPSIVDDDVVRAARAGVRDGPAARLVGGAVVVRVGARSWLLVTEADTPPVAVPP